LEATVSEINKNKILKIYGIRVKDFVTTNFKASIESNTNTSILQVDELFMEESLREIKKQFLQFVQELPVVCNNGGLAKEVLSWYIPEFKNEILDLIELVAILEPWRKSYFLEDLIDEITTEDKLHNNSKFDEVINIIKAVNSLLCRQWYREDEVTLNKSLFNTIKEVFSDNKQWVWHKYLLRPVMFLFEDYPYVLFEDKIDEIKISNNNVEYSKYEKLLQDIALWRDGGNFKYQYREYQELISNKIRENFLKKGRVFIEAPTGIGKTFAYLLIAATITYINKLDKVNDNTNFVISTDTKELQNQLIDKDIPNILNCLGLINEIKYGDMKGKSNYICIERLEKCKEFEKYSNGLLTYIFLKQLTKEGKYGDLENINYWAMVHFNINLFKQHINCESDNCDLDTCKKQCYLRNRYNKLSEDNITVVNHSLLANWPYGEKRKINNLIIDEAHNLMEKAYDFFTQEFNSADFLDLIKEIDEKNPSVLFLLNKLNSLYNYREQIDKSLIKGKAKDVEINIYSLLNEFRRMGLHNEEYNFIEEFFNGEEKNKRLLESMKEPIKILKNSIYSLYKVIDTYIRSIVNEEEKDNRSEYKGLINYTSKLRGAFEIIHCFLEFSKDYAKILEIDKEFKYFCLKNTPLNIGELINKNILNEVKSAVFLSATLRINNNFISIKKLLAQENAESLQIDPIFDLKTRTKIFTLRDIGSYKDKKIYVNNSAKFIFEVAKRTKGHLLVLFSNNLRRCLVEEKLKGLVVGTKLEIHTSKKAIPYLKDMNKEIILLGTKGFFEGIDLPGDALNCVMVDKIPNVNPTDPVYKAIKEYNGICYNEYNYPRICIKMKQGYGRLIRSMFDYGYFIILDGGTNEKTINLLERDLGGPKIQCKWSQEVINSIECDYNMWKNS
jgi:ATP-dependent DNA helicase DinG